MLNNKTEGFDLWLGGLRRVGGYLIQYIEVWFLIEVSFFRIIADVFIKAVMGYRFEPRSLTFKASKTGVRNEFLTPVNSF